MTVSAEPTTTGTEVPQLFHVLRSERETRDIRTLWLDPSDGPMPGCEPGQFMMVYAFGIGEIPISISSLGGPRGMLGLTVEAVGAVSRAVSAARPGAQLGLRGPFGNAWPLERATGGDAVVIGGGLGLAPLRPVVTELLARRDDFDHVALLYGARTSDHFLFKRQLEVWAQTLDVQTIVDRASAGWAGQVGYVAQLVGTSTLRPERTTAFICGPQIMMKKCATALMARGVPPEAIFVSLERRMECGVGVCGHCQLGPTMICRDGPVYPYATVAPWLDVPEL